VKVTKELYDYIVRTKKLSYRDGADIRELTINTAGWEEGGDHSLTYSLGF
jgi:hypothetical protein